MLLVLYFLNQVELQTCLGKIVKRDLRKELGEMNQYFPTKLQFLLLDFFDFSSTQQIHEPE